MRKPIDRNGVRRHIDTYLDAPLGDEIAFVHNDDSLADR